MVRGLLITAALALGIGGAGAGEYELKWDDGTLRI